MAYLLCLLFAILGLRKEKGAMRGGGKLVARGKGVGGLDEPLVDLGVEVSERVFDAEYVHKLS